ncbi:MAG: hypothetical protein WBV82_29345 [Myxococcaceae bacterium]
MSAPWVALSMAAVLAAPHTRIDAAVDTAAQVRSANPAGTGVAAALEVQPSLSSRTRVDGAILQARYGPRLLLSSADPDQVLGVSHQASLSGEWSPAPRWLLSMSETFSFGRTDVLPTNPEYDTSLDLVDAQLVPVPDYLDSWAELAFQLQASENVVVMSALYWSVSGATSTPSSEVFPLQHGPALLLGLEHQLTRNDVLRSNVYADHIFLSGDRGSSSVRVMESWRRVLSRSTRLELGAGVGAVQDRRSSERWGVLPVAALSLERDFLWRTERIEARLEAELAPRVSSFSGRMLPRGEASARVDWVLREKLRFGARLAGRRQLWTGSQPAEAVALSELRAGYTFNRQFRWTGGVRGIWGEIPALETPSGFQWVAFTSLTFSAEDLL